MAMHMEKVKEWLEKTFEAPFYEAEMARTKIHRTKAKKEDLVIALLASFTILCLSLFLC